MDNLFTYSTEEKLFFNFNFTLNEKNEIKITIQEINQDETITSLPYIFRAKSNEQINYDYSNIIEATKNFGTLTFYDFKKIYSSTQYTYM